MCGWPANLAAWSAGLSLLGSVLLLRPAWRASCILQSSARLDALLKKRQMTPSSFAEGIGETSKALEEEAGKWTRSSHILLMAGIVCVAAGGLLGLIDALCKAG